jgi:hypothetical protein
MFLMRSRSLDLQYSAAELTLNPSHPGKWFIPSRYYHPTWVPDWGSTVPEDVELLIKKRDNCYAARKSSAIYEIRANDKELRVLGKRCDITKSISSTISPDDSHTNPEIARLQDAQRWRDACHLVKSLKSYPTGQALEVVLLRILCYTATNSELLQAQALQAEGKHLDLGDIYNGGALTLKFSLFKSIIPLYITEAGFLGAIPSAAKEGDHIAVMSGGRLPLIIRPVYKSVWRKCEKFTYRVIGPCYVHGIMDGEAYPEDHSILDWIRLI